MGGNTNNVSELDYNDMPTSCETGLITLIHKKVDNKGVNNYRPVTLLNCIYKIRDIAIANRIAPILNLLTTETQCA